VHFTPISDRRRATLALVLSGIAILGLLIRGGILASEGFNSINSANSSSPAESMLGALSMFFCAGLLFPVPVLMLKHLKGQIASPVIIRKANGWQVMVLVSVWILIVLAGAFLNNLLSYGWIFAAPFFLLGISIPILAFIWIAVGGLPGAPRSRLWSVFGYGMVGGTLSALLLEYLLVGLAALGMGILAAANPELRTVIEQVKSRIADVNGLDVQSLISIATPYLSNPLVILSILGFAAIIAPLIEEFAKPAILWFLGSRMQSPTEGFALGILCGAGFALLEGLLAAGSAPQVWSLGMAGRAAASLMHITSSGLMGWAIATFRLKKQYWALVIIPLLSISIHGIWNGAAILAVYGTLRMVVQANQMEITAMLFMFGGLLMILLELGLLLAALPLINHFLRPKAVPAFPVMQSDIIAPPAISNNKEKNGLDPENH
jgi:hypothetical protein